MPSGERWLITGSTGLLGTAITAASRRAGAQVIRMSLQGRDGSIPLDLSSPAVAIQSALDRLNPQRVIHLAALSRPAEVSARPQAARRTNLNATIAIAEWCWKRSRWLLFTSTDQVFDGMMGPYLETHHTRPTTVYGSLKAEAETAVLAANGLVGRLGWVLNDSVSVERDFIQRGLAALREGRVVEAADDEYRTPIFSSEVAEYAVRFAQSDQRGIVHIAGRAHVTPYEMLCRVARQQGLDIRRIHRISNAALLPAGRPRDVRLDTTLLRSITEASASALSDA